MYKLFTLFQSFWWANQYKQLPLFTGRVSEKQKIKQQQMLIPQKKELAYNIWKILVMKYKLTIDHYML